MSQLVIRRFAFIFKLAILLVIAAVVASLWFVRTGEAADPCVIPNFNGPTDINLTAPRAVVVGDFNKDGKLDLAAANNRISGTISILLGNGSGGFSAPTNFSGGRNPTFLASGDFNGDGNADLVVANESSTQGEVSILLGNGAGGFGPQTFIFVIHGVQNRTTALAIGDLNGDGKADLVITSGTFNSVLILLGDGTGHFTFHQIFSSGGSFPTYILLRDLNGDGKTDLVVSNFSAPGSNSGNVATLLGDGAGNFGAASTFAVESQPISLAVGDFNGDGKSDLAVASGQSQISSLAGDGAGNFGAPTESIAGGTLYAVASGDFTADGKIDLAVLNAGGSVVIFVGDGAGAFKAAANFATSGPVSSLDGMALAVGDFNADSRPDLVAANQTQRTLSVLLNSCGSSIGSQLRLGGPSFSDSENGGFGENGSASITVMRTGDITGTGSVDYVTSDADAIAPYDYTPVSGTVNFAPGDISKSFTVQLINDNIDEGSGETFNVTLSNVTGSHSLGNPSTASVFIFDDDAAPVISISDATIAEGNGGTTSATFTVSLSNPSAFTITINYATADGSATAGSDYQAQSGTLAFNPDEVSKNISVIVNGDSLSEVNETFFVNISTAANATLADSQGLGTIADDDSACPAPSFGAPTDFSVGSNPVDLVVGDFDSDGKRDLAVANKVSNNVSVLLGSGGGGFGAATNFAVGDRPESIAAADLNLDGKPDLVTANNSAGSGASSISILLNNGGGTFTPANTIMPVANIRAVGTGDFNLDGKPDLAVASTPPSIAASTVSILLGNGSGGFGAPTGYATGTTSLFVAVADLNGDGKLDLVTSNLHSSDVSILLNQGDGTFGAATSIPVGISPVSVASGDLNGDGQLDLVVPNHATTGNVSILLGNGSGGFATGNSLTFGLNPYRTVAADINGDGNLDLAVTDPATASFPPAGGVWVLFGNGKGNYTAPVKYTVGNDPLAVVAGDFNNDGKLDLANTNFNSPNQISILLNTCNAAPPAPNVVQFSTTAYTSVEGSGNVQINVTRTDATSSATVNYATSDTAALTECNVTNGIASSRCDYATSVGTLRFAAGETSKTLFIPIVNDGYAEGNETFSITLSNPVGATLGSFTTANITIQDNETANGANPLDTVDFFIEQHYIDFLGRNPEPAGLEGWRNVLNNCGVTVAPPCDRIEVSAGFFRSPEFQARGYFIYRFFSAVGRIPLYHEFMPDFAQVSGFLSDAQLEANKAAFVNEYMARAEFETKYGSTFGNPTAYVDTLLQTVGLPNHPSRTTWINQLNANNTSQTRGEVLRALVESQQVYDKYYNEAFVIMQYFGYLRRTADISYLDWINTMNQTNGDYRIMINGFLNSAEYRRRFGP